MGCSIGPIPLAWQQNRRFLTPSIFRNKTHQCLELKREQAIKLAVMIQNTVQ